MADEGAARVEAYLAARPLPVRILARELRDLALEALPGAREDIRYGVPFWFLRAPVCYVSVAQARVTFGLLRGADVPDASGLLVGSGKSSIRKAVFDAGDAIPRATVKGWLRHAARLDEAT